MTPLPIDSTLLKLRGVEGTPCSAAAGGRALDKLAL